MIVNFILIGSVIAISLYLIVILISFDLADPSWLQTIWNKPICNLGGMIGARLSDFLFFIFGVLAYIIPIFILLYLWRICVQKARITIFTIIFELIGLLVLLFVFCGIMNLIIDNFFYFSGGILGCILCDWIYTYEYLIFHVSVGLFLIGTIGTILLFNQFFMFFLDISKKKLFHRINILKRHFYKNIKIFYRNIRCESYVQTRVRPMIHIKQYNCLQQVTHEFLNKRKFSNVSLDTDKFSKKFNFSLKNHDIPVKDIDFINNSSKLNDNNFIRRQLEYPKLDLNNDSRKMNCFRKIDCFRKKNYFNSANKYPKKGYKDNESYISANKKYKNIDLLKKNVVNQKDIKQGVTFTKKNLNQRWFFSALKKTNDSTVQYDLNKNIQNFIFPDINLLIKSVSSKIVSTLELQNISKLLEKKLAEYHILINVVNIVPGPIITRFELNLSPGIKSAKIVSLSRDLARSLSVMFVRVVEIIPGTPYVGLEIPNKNRKMVCLRDIIDSAQFQKINTPLALVLGQDVSGNPIIEDLRSMPHLLIAGTTGSGKSVGINAMIVSILYKSTPDEVRFIMIDPKILELSIYSDIPHILKPVITDIQGVNETLQWCIQEMERRYQLMAKIGVRNLENYNCYIEQLYSKKYTVDNNVLNKFSKNTVIQFDKKLIKLPYIVIIVDEFSDLMITSAKKIEELTIRLTQKARAAGIHLILATQRPSVNVITGLIKANIPARIAFTVSSKIDSHTIIGQSGAESLLGMGDMLYLASNSSMPIRVHGAFIRDQEVRAVVNFWKTQIK